MNSSVKTKKGEVDFQAIADVAIDWIKAKGFGGTTSTATDCNSLSTSEIKYTIPDTLNKPGTFNGWVFHIPLNGGFAVQLFFRSTSPFDVYRRNKFSGNFSPWERFSTINDITGFVEKAGDDMTGPLKIRATQGERNSIMKLLELASHTGGGNAPFLGFGQAISFIARTYASTEEKELSRIYSVANDSAGVDKGTDIVIETVSLASDDAPTEKLRIKHNGDIVSSEGKLETVSNAQSKADSAEQNALNHVANNYVPKEGSTTINGTKTFTESPLVPLPTLNSHAANKEFVESRNPPIQVVTQTEYDALGDVTNDPTIYMIKNEA